MAYYVELVRPREGSVGLLSEDYHDTARASRSTGAGSALLPLCLNPEKRESITAQQGGQIADCVADQLPADWDDDMRDEFIAFLRGGDFEIKEVDY